MVIARLHVEAVCLRPRLHRDETDVRKRGVIGAGSQRLFECDFILANRVARMTADIARSRKRAVAIDIRPTGDRALIEPGAERAGASGRVPSATGPAVRGHPHRATSRTSLCADRAQRYRVRQARYARPPRQGSRRGPMPKARAPSVPQRRSKLHLAQIYRVCRIDRIGHIGDAPLPAGRADRNRIGGVGHRGTPDRDRARS